MFDPYQLLTIKLEMTDQDWSTVRHDTTNEIEVPAHFWVVGDTQCTFTTKCLVSVRRKSSKALPSEGSPQKVSLKIDIDEYDKTQIWRGLIKLSLENGAGSAAGQGDGGGTGTIEPGVVAEGFAWNLHQLASTVYGYQPGFAAWVRVNVNGQDIGVYASVEQRDKRMLTNRLLPDKKGKAWIYDMGDIGSLALEFGDETVNSPAVTWLNYSPFSVCKRNECPRPDDPTIEAELTEFINMQGMLTLGAVDAFLGNGDALMSHGKNAFFADFNPGRLSEAEVGGITRMYFPWDLDSVIHSTTASIYGKETAGKKNVTQSEYQERILNHSVFREKYRQTVTALFATGGPLDETSLHAFLNGIEPVLAAALAEDPYPTVIGDVADHFTKLRNWVSARISNVLLQAGANGPPAPRLQY